MGGGEGEGGEASDGGDSLDARLLARYQRLKEEPRAHPLQEDSEILGAHLALRLAALKSPQTHITQTRKPETWGFSAGRKDPTSDGLEVEKLLESISDEVRLQKLEPPTQNLGHDEEISDSEVDNLVEWAKDAAALNPQLSDEEEADPVFDGDVLTVPVAGEKRSSNSDVDNRAKDAAALDPHIAEEADLVFDGDVVPVPGAAFPIKKKDLIKEKKDTRWKFW